MSNNDNKFLLKFLSDFFPLIAFFLTYKLSTHDNPIIPATICLIIATIISLSVIYYYNKKIAKMPLFSAILLGFFGGITVFSGNDIFIKMKPTIINLLFAAILFVGYFLNKPFIKYLANNQISLDDKSWLNLSLIWGFFFIFLAIVNEIIWRNFSTDFWVKFKVLECYQFQSSLLY